MSASSLVRVATLSVVASLIAASAAIADTEVRLEPVSNGSQLAVEGGLLQRQSTQISIADGFFHVLETNPNNPRLDPGDGCVRLDARLVRCPMSGVVRIHVSAKDLGDVVSISDTITTPTTLFGGEGDDTLTGGSGPDFFANGGDRDGADRFFGRAGQDLMSYEGRDRPVTITVDGVANDGQTGEGDLVAADIETLRGGDGDDILQSNELPHRLEGRGGDDDMTGAGGADSMDGGFGNDTLRDDLDRVADVFNCSGSFGDRAFLDLVDERAGTPIGCEAVFISAIDQHPNVQIRALTDRVTLAGKVRLQLTCPRQQANGCAGELTLASGSQTIGTKPYTLGPGDRAVRVFETRRRRLRATALERDPNGQPKTTLLSIRLKARR